MMSEETIERLSFEHLETQKKACANVRKSQGDWTAAEEDCYTMGFETGYRVAVKAKDLEIANLRDQLTKITGVAAERAGEIKRLRCNVGYTEQQLREAMIVEAERRGAMRMLKVCDQYGASQENIAWAEWDKRGEK